VLLPRAGRPVLSDLEIYCLTWADIEGLPADNDSTHRYLKRQGGPWIHLGPTLVQSSMATDDFFRGHCSVVNQPELNGSFNRHE
jgi:hypothetical protein